MQESTQQDGASNAPDKLPILWIDGAFVEPDDARISALDAGFQHAVGLFETMLVVTNTPGKAHVHRARAHLERMLNSATSLRLLDQFDIGALLFVLQEAADRAALPPGAHARLRLTLTGGDMNLLGRTTAAKTDAHHPTIVLQLTPAATYPDQMFDRGITLTIAAARANPFRETEGHKTLDYWWRLRELQDAAVRNAGECLILQVSNHIAGGAVSNLFAVRDGALLTPIAHGEESKGSIPAPVLPGITRDTLIDYAESNNITATKRMMTIADVLDADELFLTNSSWGVLPAVQVEGKTIGAGKPGPITQQLRAAWLEDIARCE